MRKNKIETNSSKETHDLGVAFGKQLLPNAIVALQGDLGAGKTTFIRGLVEGVGSVHSREVCSPTFTYLNIYEAKKTIYHFDLYRLSNSEAFFLSGFDEYFTKGGICCIEWADRIKSDLPKETFFVHIGYLGEEKREISISKGEK